MHDLITTNIYICVPCTRTRATVHSIRCAHGTSDAASRHTHARPWRRFKTIHLASTPVPNTLPSHMSASAHLARWRRCAVLSANLLVSSGAFDADSTAHLRQCARGADVDTPLGRVLGIGAEARCAPSGGRRSRIRVSREAAPEVPCPQRIECTVARVRVQGTCSPSRVVIRSCMHRVLCVFSTPTKPHNK